MTKSALIALTALGRAVDSAMLSQSFCFDREGQSVRRMPGQEILCAEGASEAS